jgi:hypothetical protein
MPSLLLQALNCIAAQDLHLEALGTKAFLMRLNEVSTLIFAVEDDALVPDLLGRWAAATNLLP